MCQVSCSVGARQAARFAFAGLAAALLAGCADTSRLVGDPLGNPFKTASSAPASYGADLPPPPAYTPTRTAAIRSQSLMPSSPMSATRSMSAPRVASYEAPTHQSPQLASDYHAPRTERTASIGAPSGHGSWSPEGGMAVIAANGDTAGVLAARYNVPTDALLRANDFTSAAAIRPGTRVVIPVYNASGAPARVATSEPRHVEPLRRDHSSREKLLAKREPAKHEAVSHEPSRQELQARRDAERDAKLAKFEKAERDAKEAKLARYEKAEHEKTMKWAKGPSPAKTSLVKVAETGKAHGHDAHGHDMQARDMHGREKALAKLDVGKPEKPVRVAKAEPASKVEDMPRKAAPAPVDTTPTASLPPSASDKVAVPASGNPEFRWPAHGRIIQGFKSGGNDGINIAVPEGTAVKAAESGTVAYAGSEIKGFGNLVLIRHPNGYVTAYANNGDISVHRGEQVKRGQTIAKSGQSGNVASPQLHFELRKGSTPVDPTRYLAGL